MYKVGDFGYTRLLYIGTSPYISPVAMDAYKETFDTWNKVASLYEEKFMQLDLYNASYDFLCDTIPKEDASLLDLGCGPGNITRYLLQRKPGYRIKGVDIAPNMIDLARKNNPQAEFEILDIRELNTIRDTFDAIVCGFSIPYLSQAETAALFVHASSLLTKEGILYISYVEGDPAASGYKTSSTGDRTWFYYHRSKDLLVQLAVCGFSVIKEIAVDYNSGTAVSDIHTILIARRN